MTDPPDRALRRLANTFAGHRGAPSEVREQLFRALVRQYGQDLVDRARGMADRGESEVQIILPGPPARPLNERPVPPPLRRPASTSAHRPAARSDLGRRTSSGQRKTVSASSRSSSSADDGGGEPPEPPPALPPAVERHLQDLGRRAEHARRLALDALDLAGQGAQEREAVVDWVATLWTAVQDLRDEQRRTLGLLTDLARSVAAARERERDAIARKIEGER